MRRSVQNLTRERKESNRADTPSRAIAWGYVGSLVLTSSALVSTPK